MSEMSDALCKYCKERKVISEVYAVCSRCKNTGGRKSIGETISSLGKNSAPKETPVIRKIGGEDYERPQKYRQNDNSWGVATVVMVVFGFIGLGIGGLAGLLLGAIFGFGVSGVVMGTQEWLK